MFDLILHAIPVFVLCLAVESLSFYFLPADEERGYETRDAITSISMGLGNVVVNAGWKLVVLTTYAALYLASPIRLSSHNIGTWIALFVLDDLAFYWYHRLHHTVRLFWASHVVHHSSEFYNLSTALRQPWTPMTSMPFWIPLALLGIPPWMILLQQSASLLYQFFLHTERIGKLGRPIEFVMNTPSHHRVHHGSQQQYLDRNYGGVLIVWDRLFGTFEPEGDRVQYGLTKNLHSYNLFRIAFGEYRDIYQDVRRAGSWRDRVGFAFRGPGWEPPQCVEE